MVIVFLFQPARCRAEWNFPLPLLLRGGELALGAFSAPYTQNSFVRACSLRGPDFQLFWVWLPDSSKVLLLLHQLPQMSWQQQSGIAQLKSGSDTRKVVIPTECSSKAVFTCILGHEAQSCTFMRPQLNPQMSKLCALCWFEWEEMKSITADPWIKGRASRFVTAMAWCTYIELCCCYPQASAPSEACPTCWGMSVCVPSVCLQQIDSLSEYGAETTFAHDSWEETDYTMQVGDLEHGFVGKKWQWRWRYHQGRNELFIPTKWAARTVVWALCAGGSCTNLWIDIQLNK